MLLVLQGGGRAQDLKTLKLNEPNKKRGLPFMEALAVKASAREFSEEELSLQDLSDLLWAANGVNRPDEKKYTASSAMNAHDVDLYLFTKEGAYLYDADSHTLTPILSGDHRSELMMTPPPKPRDAGGPPPGARPAPSNPPVQIMLVSDIARFRAGTQELKVEWGAIDVGIVSQNISLFCAATGLKTRPRASMDRENVRKLLGLRESQHLFLNHPVGYAKR
jgi:SagB-type dehydrogenase family enzyme